MSVLVSEALNVSTAHTTPNILRGFSLSHSKRSGATSAFTANRDPPENCLEIKVGGGGSIHSPTVEATSVSPAVAEPLNPVPTSPSEKTGEEESMYSKTASDDPDPLFLPLPPSPPCPSSPLMDLVDPVQPPDDLQEVNPFFHYNDPLPPEDWTVSSSSGHPRLPATGNIALTTPLPDRTVQSAPAQSPPPVTAAPGPDRDEDEIPEPYIPPLTAPTMSPPIPNAHPSYLFESVFTWWLSKDILSYPCLYF